MRFAPPPLLGVVWFLRGPSCPRWDSCEFLGFCPAAVARTLCFRGVCPVNLVGSCGFAFLLFLGGCPFALARGFHAFFVWSRSCRSNPPIVKTKISASLQLFCDCELFPVPAKRKRGLHTANYLRFCAAIRDWGARNNCQSQKSCNSDRFFVSGLLE